MDRPERLADAFGPDRRPAGQAAPAPKDQDGPGLPAEPHEPYDDGPPTERYDPPADLYQPAPTQPADDAEELDVIAPPQLPAGALSGRAGRILRALAPHTEADPAALLVTLLAWFGAMVGRGPFIMAGEDEHPARLWPLIVGRSSVGAKGTSLSAIRRLMTAADPTFDANVATGLTSGEGLIEYLRDPTADLDPDAPGFDEGVPDKRLLMLETEFATVIARGRRDSSTLLGVLRDAWDGSPLQTLARKKNSLRSTGHHVAVIAHISPGELLSVIRAADLANGTINRYLMTHSTRSKLLPSGGNIPADILDQLAAEVSAALSLARTRREFYRDEVAEELWTPIYEDLAADKGDGPFADAVNRGKTQALRLSLAYALLDGSDVITAEHVTAAYELWTYCEDTARWLFLSDKDAAQEREHQRLIEFIATGGKDGVTRTDISNRLYQRHKSAGAITALLRPLLKDGRVRSFEVRGRGRTATRFVTTRKD